MRQTPDRPVEVAQVLPVKAEEHMQSPMPQPSSVVLVVSLALQVAPFKQVLPAQAVGLGKVTSLAVCNQDMRLGVLHEGLLRKKRYMPSKILRASGSCPAK